MIHDIQRKKHAHCHYCGYPYREDQPWPRLCNRCKNITYRNPLPVAVILIPVGPGLVTVRRRIAPASGRLALPGGYVEVGETWQEAGAREVYEETGIQLDANEVSDFCVRSAPDDTILIFGIAPGTRVEDLPAFRPTEEVSERAVILQPTELAFPLHTAAAREFFLNYPGFQGAGIS